MGPFRKTKGREFTSFPVYGSVQMSVHQIPLVIKKKTKPLGDKVFSRGEADVWRSSRECPHSFD